MDSKEHEYLNELRHLRHCNFGEWYKTCKYGPEEECPALTEWGWLPGAYAAAGHAEFKRCPLCGDQEKVEDIVGGVCLVCADAIAFTQNARRGAIRVVVTTGDEDDSV